MAGAGPRAKNEMEETNLRKGKVVEALPNALFRVQLANQRRVLAHVAARARQDFLRLLPGDEIEVRLSASDHTRGRIVKRSKT